MRHKAASCEASETKSLIKTVGNEITSRIHHCRRGLSERSLGGLPPTFCLYVNRVPQLAFASACVRVCVHAHTHKCVLLCVCLVCLQVCVHACVYA